MPPKDCHWMVRVEMSLNNNMYLLTSFQNAIQAHKSQSSGEVFLDDSKLMQEKESLLEQRRLFNEEKINFTEERKQFTEAAIKLEKEVSELDLQIYHKEATSFQSF